MLWMLVIGKFGTERQFDENYFLEVKCPMFLSGIYVEMGRIWKKHTNGGIK
jgi:hypothetical protein